MSAIRRRNHRKAFRPFCEFLEGRQLLNGTPAILTLGPQVGTLIDVQTNLLNSGSRTTVSAGPITGTSISYDNGQTQVDLPSGAYSVNLLNPVTYSQSYNTATVSDDGVVNGTSVNNPDQIAWLLSHEAASANTAAAQAGLQAAIWYVEYNGNGNTFAGPETLDPASSIATAEQADLTALTTAYANGDSGAIGALLWITPDGNNNNVQAQVALDPTYDTTAGTLTENITYGTTLDQAVNEGLLPAVVFVQGNAVEGTYTFTNGNTDGTNDVTDTVLNVGHYDLTATFNPTDTSDYNSVTTTASIDITKAQLQITAADATRVYGQDNPDLTSEIYIAQGTGWVDTGQSWTADTTATTNSAVGSYAIHPTTITDPAFLANYDVSYVGANLSITARPITVTAATNSKTYDGTTSAAATPTITSGSLATGDTANFTETYDTKNVGTGKTLTPAGSVNDGNGGANYAVTFVNNTTGAINKASLTITATGVNKVYDGTTAATVTLSDNRVPGDVLTDSYTTASFSDKNVGTSKTVSVSGISIIGGADAGNYTFNTTATTTADITQRPITVTADAKAKFYGSSDPTLTYQVTSGSLVSGDAFSGALSRAAGESVGTYPILQNTLTAGSNYNLTYVGNTLTIVGAPTTTSVAASPNPSVFGQSVTFTATLTGVGTPTGSVTFLDGSTTLGSGTLNTSGKATFVISTLAVGPHSLTAVYGGNTTLSGSTSPVLTETVNKANTTTALIASPSSSVFGQSVTFTATISAMKPGAGTPTGTVTFEDGSTTLGTGTLSGGVATFTTTTALAVGSHSSITAVYGSDANFNGSTSPAVTETVNKANTTTALIASPSSSVFGQSVTFTATISATAPGAGTPTGTVTFKDGSATLGTGTLSGGVATFTTTTALAVGSHSSITAVYGSDASFKGSTSPAVTETVGKADTTTALVASPSSSVFGQSVTFTATVTGAGTPTGTVTFKDGSTTLGTGTLSTSGSVTTATFTTSTLAVGSHSITAV